MIPRRIISGGQTGADQGALDFAIQQGIEHGGWCPRGRKCDEGMIPSRFKLKETESWQYQQRTEANVRDSDFTVIFNAGPSLSRGSALTLNYCKRHHKPFLILRGTPDGGIDDREAKLFARAIVEWKPSVLNVAGNRESSIPGMHQHVINMLGRAWHLIGCQEIAAQMEAERVKQPQQTTLKLGI